MKKFLKIALMLAIIGVIAAFLVWKFYINKPHENIEKATPAYSLTTSEIWNQYTTDQKLADSLYNNKVIELTGTLDRIEKRDSLVSVIFVMAADPMFGDKTISCQMYQKHNVEAAALSVGTKLKIKGFCTGYDETDIKFNKCSIVK